MQSSLYPSYHMVGPNLVLDIPVSGAVPVPTYVSVSLTPALYVEEAFPEHFAYTCVLHSDSALLPPSGCTTDAGSDVAREACYENYVQAAAKEISKHVKFYAFPFSAEDAKATICFTFGDVTVDKDGATAIPFYLMLKPTAKVFNEAVNILDMQASALAGARAAGALTVPNMADLLNSPASATPH